jgi:F-type H+-transporting ATPase subunit delta
MLETKVAKRYAKSLLDLSREQGVLDAVNADMQLLAQVCDANRDLTLLLSNPIINSDKKLNVLQSVFGSSVSKLSMAFFDILTRKGREANLAAIAKEFVAMYKKSKGIETAVITSAVALNDSLRAQIQKALAENVKASVELVEKVDSKLIGGFVLRIGDRQFDSSVASELRKLTREFSANPYLPKL